MQLRPGCSIGVVLWQLEIPPVGANSMRTVDAAASARLRPAARRFGWSGPYGEEFAPDTSASARIPDRVELLAIRGSGSLRRNELGAIASEKNDCNFPWRRQPRRMPRTRQRQERRKHPDQRTSKTGGVHLALSVRTNPEENCFPLTYSFRNGPASSSLQPRAWRPKWISRWIVSASLMRSSPGSG